MAELVVLLRFDHQATTPKGDPSGYRFSGRSTEITVLEGGALGALPEPVFYETQVTLTGETSFFEDGDMMFGVSGDDLRITTVGEGILRASAEAGVLHGSVIWRVEDGQGRFAGATGLIASNFIVEEDGGEGTEYQVMRLFIP